MDVDRSRTPRTEGHDYHCNFSNIVIQGKTLGSGIVVDAQVRSPGCACGAMFKTVVCSGSIRPDVYSSQEGGRDETGGAGEVVSGVRGEGVASARRGYRTYLVVLSEKGHRGCEDTNASGRVAHGRPNADS